MSEYDELLARLEIGRASQDEIDAAAAIRDLTDKLEAAERELLGVKEYRQKNPLGGPAKVFDAMADRIRAGEDYYAVLTDYRFCTMEQLESRLAAERERCAKKGYDAAFNHARDEDGVVSPTQIATSVMVEIRALAPEAEEK